MDPPAALSPSMATTPVKKKSKLPRLHLSPSIKSFQGKRTSILLLSKNSKIPTPQKLFACPQSPLSSPIQTPTKTKIPIPSTPIKVNLPICIVCGRADLELRQIHSAAGMKKGLPELLLRFCDLNITQGLICRNDESRLKTMNDKILQIKSETRKTLDSLRDRQAIKRLSNSPVKKDNISEKIINTPITSSSGPRKSSKKQLFPKPAPVLQIKSTEDHQHRPSPVTSDHAYISVAKQTPPMNITSPLTPSPADHGYSHTKVTPQVFMSTITNKIIHSQRTTLHSGYLTPQQSQALIYEARNGNPTAIADIMSSINELNHAYCLTLQEKHDSNVSLLTATRHGYVSVLMKRHGSSTHEQLKHFNWDNIVTEMMDKFPALLHICLGLMLPQQKRVDPVAVEAVLPRLGMVYAICMQQRIHTLSLVQRMMAAILTEGLSDVRVCLRLYC